MGSKRPPDWTTNEERKPQERVYWPCLDAQIPNETVKLAKFCSPFCEKEHKDGSCAVEVKQRVLDANNPEDWAFMRNADMILGPTKYVFP